MAVAGKTAEEIYARAEFFKALIERQLTTPSLSGMGLTFDESIPSVLAECYFALSEGYKKIRLFGGARSDPTKVSALTCATIAYVQPLRPPDASNVEHEEILYANPILAVRTACSIVEYDFDKKPHDDRMRIYRFLFNMTLPCIAPIIGAANNSGGPISKKWDVTLNQNEINKLDMLVSLFVSYRDHASQ